MNLLNSSPFGSSRPQVLQNLVGSIATALTELNCAGFIVLNNGILIDAIAIDEFVKAGQYVVITEVIPSISLAGPRTLTVFGVTLTLPTLYPKGGLPPKRTVIGSERSITSSNLRSITDGLILLIWTPRGGLK